MSASFVMTRERGRGRGLLAGLLRGLAGLAVFGLVVWGALHLFLIRSVVEQPIKGPERLSDGSVQLQIEEVDKMWRLGLWGVKFFQYAVEASPPRKAIIWVREGDEFVPRVRVPQKFLTGITNAGMIFPAAVQGEGCVWMVKVERTVSRKIRIGPIRIQHDTPVQFVTAPLTNGVMQR